jgi:hypothetical protein
MWVRALLREVALERANNRPLLVRRQIGVQLEPARRETRGVGPTRGAAVRGTVPFVVAHSGMFPCLRAGIVSRFVPSIRSALIKRGRVSAGSITSSMNPRSAAMYGVANFS